MGDEAGRGRQEARDINGDRRGRDAHSRGGSHAHAKHCGNGTTRGEHAAHRSLGGRGRRIGKAQAGLDRQDVVQLQRADVLQGPNVKARGTVGLEDALAAHRGLGRGGCQLDEAEGSGGHGSGQRLAAGHLARDGHRLTQGREGRRADALGDDSGADRAHLRVLPPLDFVPVGGVGLAHACTQIVRHALPVSLAVANSPTLHSEGRDRCYGTSASPVMLVTW